MPVNGNSLAANENAPALVSALLVRGTSICEWLSVTFPASSRTGMMDSPMAISYEMTCAADRSAGLDPEVDYERISRDLALYDFPWDTVQALSFALFRTYAVPGIGRLLHETGEFTRNTQQRRMMADQPETILSLGPTLRPTSSA